jgi:3',5'-nucleoside bisphosphate phosphatase
MAVTDHDTVAATGEIARLSAARGIESVSAIEITAVSEDPAHSGRDVHVLGYFIDPAHGDLNVFLAQQRQDRISRGETIGVRLASLGMPIDVGVLVAAAMRLDGHSIGRPQVARAMVDARHVADTREAFDRWLGYGKPAFVPRTGAAPARVIEIIHAAGGLASLAHPGQTGIDDHLRAFRDAGLDALEVFHSDHPPEATERYRRIAADLDLLVTGGSDFHGDPAHGLEPGAVTLPADDWRRLLAARRAV